MHALSVPPVHRLAPWAPVILRVVLGGIMALHGWQKLTEMGPAMFGQSMVADLGLPAPELLGWLITVAELVGGVLLIVGLLTRLSAVALTVVLTGALLLVKTDLGVIAPMGSMLPGAELDLALIAGLIGVMLFGPGKPSVDHLIGVERSVPELRTADSPTSDQRIPA